MDEAQTPYKAHGPGLSLWRNRNLLVLVGGQWVSQVGNALFQMAVYWTVLQETGSRSDLGFTGSVLAVAGIFGLVAGALVDRWDRRRTMIWVDVGRAVLAFGLVAGALTHRLPILALLGVVFVMTLGSQFFYPAESAMLPAVVTDEELMGANSLNQSASAMAQLVGMSLGGVILGLLGPVVLFGFNGVSFAVSVASLVLLRVTSRPPAGDGTGPGLLAAAASLWRDIVQGQRTTWQSPFLRRVLPITAIANFAMTPIDFLGVAWVRQDLHLGAFVYGLFGVAEVVGLLIGSAGVTVVSGRLTMRTLIGAALLGGGACVVALSRIALAVPDLSLLATFGILVGVVNTMVAASLQQAVPDEVRGRVFGTFAAVQSLTTPVGGILTGLGAAILPVGVLFAAAGCLVSVSSLLVLGMPSHVEEVEISA